MKHAPLLILVAALSIAITYALTPRAVPAAGGSPPIASLVADEYAFVAYGSQAKEPIEILEGEGVLVAVIGTQGAYQLCEGPIDKLRPITSALKMSQGADERLDVNVRIRNGLFVRQVSLKKDQKGWGFGSMVGMGFELYASLGPDVFDPSDAIGFTVIFRRGG